MFIDCSDLIEENLPQISNGACILDFDGDGRFEIFICGFGCDNKVLKWENGKLVPINISFVVKDPQGEAICACAADIDGDGKEEIYVLNNDSEDANILIGDRLFACFGPEWMDLFASVENHHALNLGSGRSVAAIDRHGKSQYGFVVANKGSPWKLYELNSKGKIRDSAEEAGIDIIADGQSVISAQIIGERMDIFATTRSANVLFRNMGGGQFEEIAHKWNIADTAHIGMGSTVLDADGDGLVDIIYGNENGPTQLYLQRPGGGFTQANNRAMTKLQNVQNIIVADFDNDGKEEIFVHTMSHQNYLFKRDEDDEWVRTPLLEAIDSKGEGRGAVVCDIDGDGLLELVLTRGFKTPQKLKMFKSVSKNYNWLRICPLTPSGAPARGAIVKAWVSGKHQVRSICAGSGYLCQMEPVAHFGLNTAKMVDRIEIKWPDGGYDVLENIKCNQMLSILHPEGRTETVAERC